MSYEQNGNKINSLTAKAGENITLTVNGYCFMYYGCALPATREKSIAPIEEAHLCLVNADTGELTDIPGAVTDEEGEVTFSIATAGEYLLSAYIDAEDIEEGYYSPAIMTLLPLTIEDVAPGSMSDEDAINTIYNEFTDAEKNYNTAAGTPLVFPMVYDGKTYTNLVAYLKAWGKKETGRDINITYTSNPLTTGYADWQDGTQKSYVPVAMNDQTEITQNYYKDNAVLTQRISNVKFSLGSVEKTIPGLGIYVKVNSLQRTPQEIVEYIANNLPFARIKGSNVSQDYITSVLQDNGATTLPTADKLYTNTSATIAWSLEPEIDGDKALTIASNKITVKRPNVGEPDSNIVLKATITSKADTNVKAEKTYNLTVPAFEEVIVPIMITEGANLSIQDGVYSAAVPEKYIVKQESTTPGYDLYHLSLHSNATGGNATFTCTISKDGYLTNTTKLSVGSKAPENVTKVDLVASSNDDTALSTLSVITPSVTGLTFDKDTTTYDITVASGEYIKLAGVPIATGATAKITQYYSSLANANKTPPTVASTGNLSATGTNCYLPDAPGTSTIKVTVTAPTGSTLEEKTRVYTINVTKTNANAPLKALVLAAKSTTSTPKNTINSNIDIINDFTNEEDLAPAFVTGAKENAYNYTVNYRRDKITIKPTVYNASTYDITINGDAISSGVASGEYSLNVGDNPFVIKTINKEDSSEVVYNINVHRKKDIRITDVTLDCGILTELKANDWVGSTAFAYDADEVNVTYHTNVSDGVTIKLIADGKVYEGIPGEPIKVDVTGKSKISPNIYLLYDDDGKNEVQKYVISFNRSSNSYPSSVTSFLPAPGQFVNLLEYMAPARVLTKGGTITLGSFGGNVVYKFDEPIKNNPNNKYGIDFIIAGNAFTNQDGSTASGSAEPASVMVSKDGSTWYELAGSEYYAANTERNVTITYTNPDTNFTKAQNVPYELSNGDNGNILANTYHSQAYYPNPENYGAYQSGVGKNTTYTADSVSFTGTLIDYGFYPFGYADTHTHISGNIATNPYIENHVFEYNADGFDIDWAVDQNGDRVTLDEISYVKIYNATLYDGGSIGEKSAEITMVSKVEAMTNAVGKTADLTGLTINGDAVSLTAGTYAYAIDGKNASTLSIVPQTANANTNIYVSNVRTESGQAVNIPAVSKLRIIVQEGEREPAIYILTLTNVMSKEGNADLSSLVLSPGDVIKSPNAEGNITFDVENNLNTIRLFANTAGKGASISIISAKLENPINVAAGKQSAAIALDRGENSFTIRVTSKDGANTKDYSLVVNRAEQSTPQDKENTIVVKFSLTGDVVHYDKDAKSYTGKHNA